MREVATRAGARSRSLQAPGAGRRRAARTARGRSARRRRAAPAQRRAAGPRPRGSARQGPHRRTRSAAGAIRRRRRARAEARRRRRSGAGAARRRGRNHPQGSARKRRPPQRRRCQGGEGRWRTHRRREDFLRPDHGARRSHRAAPPVRERRARARRARRAHRRRDRGDRARTGHAARAPTMPRSPPRSKARRPRSPKRKPPRSPPRPRTTMRARDLEAARAALANPKSACSGWRPRPRRSAKMLALETRNLWPPVIDHVSVDKGYEKALGAALGDDLDAPVDASAPMHWSTIATGRQRSGFAEGRRAAVALCEGAGAAGPPAGANRRGRPRDRQPSSPPRSSPASGWFRAKAISGAGTASSPPRMRRPARRGGWRSAAALPRSTANWQRPAPRSTASAARLKPRKRLSMPPATLKPRRARANATSTARRRGCRRWPRRARA